jgi:hypothetical protein
MAPSDVPPDWRKIAREAFLDLVADAKRWDFEPDADVNDAGHWIDCSTVTLAVGLSSLSDFLNTIGIKYDESQETAYDSINRVIKSS